MSEVHIALVKYIYKIFLKRFYIYKHFFKELLKTKKKILTLRDYSVDSYYICKNI